MLLQHNIESGQIIAAIANTLRANDDLVAKLAESAPINDADGELDRKNSIVPMSKVADETSHRPCPLIGIRSGSMVRVGNHSYDVFIYIRCYNNVDKAYVEINDILSFVNRLLDRQFIAIPSVALSSEMTLEQVTDEDYDEGFKLNYRESQFRLQIT